MAFVFTILASVFLITSSGFVCVIQAQGVSLLVSPPFLLSETDFSFALLLATFEPLEIYQSYIPFWKAQECGIIA